MSSSFINTCGYSTLIAVCVISPLFGLSKCIINNNSLSKTGEFTEISGPMCAGKTTMLIQLLEKEKEDETCLFKPNLDRREGFVLTHDGLEEKAIDIDIHHPEAIWSHLQNNNIKKIFIDEFQFFDSEIINVIKTILNNNIDVIIAGLDLDFRRKEFGQTVNIIKELALYICHIHTLTAKCMICNDRAPYTARLINGNFASENDQQIVIDKQPDIQYAPICSRCFDLGEKLRSTIAVLQYLQTNTNLIPINE
jgi:thymidine kinase